MIKAESRAKNDQRLGTESTDGLLFGKLKVIGVPFYETQSSGRRHRYVRCVCECGGEWSGRLSRLRRGDTVSCGCERIRKATKHGQHGTVEYFTWKTIRQRCTNPNHPKYKLYGGRGISLCESWTSSFDNFWRDMGPRPTPLHSVDRIDNNGNYEPANCRWADKRQQSNNTRRCIMLTFYGKTMSASEWGRISQVSPTTIHARLRMGWSPKLAVWKVPENGSKAGK